MKFLLCSTFFVVSLLPCAHVAANNSHSSRGKIEVVAMLVDIPGSFPPDDLYDYAHVMKYQVKDGALKGQTIFVAHYKPRKKRSAIKDKMSRFVGGKLKRFRVGDVHKMILDSNLRKIWSGPVTDEYFVLDRNSPRYWCLEVNSVN